MQEYIYIEGGDPPRKIPGYVVAEIRNAALEEAAAALMAEIDKLYPMGEYEKGEETGFENAIDVIRDLKTGAE